MSKNKDLTYILSITAPFNFYGNPRSIILSGQWHDKGQATTPHKKLGVYQKNILDKLFTTIREKKERFSSFGIEVVTLINHNGMKRLPIGLKKEFYRRYAKNFGKQE